MRLLAASYRGHHLEHPGVHRISTRHAELSEPLPLVADAVSLGTTTATVSVERDRLRVAAPDPGGADMSSTGDRVRLAAPRLLFAFSLAAVGAGTARALTTSYLPVLLDSIDDAPA